MKIKITEEYTPSRESQTELNTTVNGEPSA